MEVVDNSRLVGLVNVQTLKPEKQVQVTHISTKALNFNVIGREGEDN